jgi:hypothetical protein
LTLFVLEAFDSAFSRWPSQRFAETGPPEQRTELAAWDIAAGMKITV